MLTGILVFFHVIACFTLILAILLQVGRGHGLSGASFAQSGVQTVFGTRTVDFLSKATTVMAIVFVITCISLDILQARKSRSLFAPGGGGASKVDLEKIREALVKLQQEQAQKKSDQGAAGTAATTPQPAAAAKPGENAAETSTLFNKSDAGSTPSPLPSPPSRGRGEGEGEVSLQPGERSSSVSTPTGSSSRGATQASAPLPAEAPSKGG